MSAFKVARNPLLLWTCCLFLAPLVSPNEWGEFPLPPSPAPTTSPLDNLGGTSSPPPKNEDWIAAGYDLDMQSRFSANPGVVEESLREEVEAELPELLKKGYRNAQMKLEQENEVIRITSDNGKKMIYPRGFHFRKTSMEAKEASACRGLGMLETSRLILQKFNVSKDISYDFLRSFSASPEGARIHSQFCDSHRRNAPKSITCSPNFPYRTISGICNNLNPGREREGSAGTPFKRYLSADYEDGVGAMRGAGTTRLPNPRHVSFLINQIPSRGPSPHITQMLKAWGQLLDHDITRTPESTGSTDLNNDGKPDHIPCCEGNTLTTDDCAAIDVSPDPFYSHHGQNCLRFVRSMVADSGSSFGPREQINDVTSFIDASSVYGSDEATALRLRSGFGGLLRTGEGGEQCSSFGSSCSMPFLPEVSTASDNIFQAGDVRVNEQPPLTSMHTILLRLHNNIANELHRLNPAFNDEILYQESRRIVGAVVQHITYAEFLPITLGNWTADAFSIYPKTEGYQKVYKHWINPSIANVFSTAAYRFGHSLVGEEIHGKDASIPLAECFFHNSFTKHSAPMFPSEIVKGECSVPSEHSDAKLVETLTHKLFAGGPHFTHGSDLFSLNIQRGRDHGLPSFNSWRKFCRKEKFSTFEEMKNMMDPVAADMFQHVYNSVEDIDLFPAGIAEHHVPNGFIGDTLACLLAIQFHELKFADRFWYESDNQPVPFNSGQLSAIRSTSLAAVICSTTNASHMQKFPMINKSLSGNPILSCDSLTENAVVNSLKKFWKSAK